MLATYTFNTQYQPKGNYPHPSLRLLEGGKFAKGQFAPVLVQEYQQVRLKYFRWGLIPAWTKAHRQEKGRHFAPANQLFQQPAFLMPVRRRRCLIPADGFYTQADQHAQNRSFKLSKGEGETFCFAGIFDTWKKPEGGELHTFAIVTVPSNNQLQRFGLQMPLILPSNVEGTWLSPYTDLNKIQKLLSLPSGMGLNMHPIQELRLPETKPFLPGQAAA